MSTIPGGSEPTYFHRCEYRKLRIDAGIGDRKIADAIYQDGWRIEHIAMMPNDPIVIFTLVRARYA
jgi:hypothetical protein